MPHPQLSETLGAQAEAIFQNLGDDRFIAFARMARTMGQLGQRHAYPSLLKSIDDAVSILRKLNQLPLLAFCLNTRGEIANVNEDYDQAQISYLESLKLCREIGNRRRECMMLGNLGSIAIHREQYAQAGEYLKAGLRLMVEIDFNLVIAVDLVNFAMLWSRIGRPKQAAQLLSASEVFRNSMAVSLELPEQRIHDRTVDQLRAQLGDDAFQAAWEAGRKLSYDEAIAFMLDAED
jgi:tetratricopeptide (TPR) repeat protein